MDPDASVAAIAVRQHGLVTRAQARAAGLTDDQIDGRLACGRWLRIRRGVYLIAGAPPSQRQAVLAACLAAGGDAAASHLSAARLWGLDLPAPHEIELVGGRRRHDGVTARTLVDCARRVPAERLGPIVDDALRRGLVKLAALRACHERIDTGPGRRPTVAMREVLAMRRPGHEAGDSGREIGLVRLLAQSGLPAPVLGHRVTIGRRTYKLDVAWPEWLAALEFDGWDTHRTFSAFHGDRQRLRRLVAIGWRIIPVTAQTDQHELIGEVTRLLTGQLSA